MEAVLKDFVFALRQLGKSPIFTIIAVLTLTLGIGANTAVFSVMNAVLLRSLPVRDPHGLYYLRMPADQGQPDGADNIGDNGTSFSYPVFSALRQRHDVLQALIAYAPLSMDTEPIRVGSTPLAATGEAVSGNFFSGLTAGMLLGRPLTPADEQRHAPVVVLSYAFWTQAYARSPHVLGTVLYVRGVPLTIIGVAARGFFGVESGQSTDFWIPLQTNPALNVWGPDPQGTIYSRPAWWSLRLIGRLAHGITPQQAQAALASTFLAAAQQGVGHIDTAHWKPRLDFTPARGIENDSRLYRQPLEILMGLVLLILLIALTNVAMMLRARNAARAREFSLRLALGSGRARLFTQLLTESGMLVIAGALLGWLCAVAATRWLAAMAQIGSGLAPDSTVLVFTLAVSIVAALAFGLAPLRAAVRLPIAGVLRSSGSQLTLSRRAVLTGNLALIAQVAFCLVLLMAASLLLRTLNRYHDQPLGMDATHLLVFGITPAESSTSQQRLVFYHALLDRLQALPGVQAASMVMLRPGNYWSSNIDFLLDGVHQQGQVVRRNYVGSGYFHAVGTAMLAGREFTRADSPQSARVALVNQTFAHRFYPHGDAIGHILTAHDPPAAIVGVVADSKYTSTSESPMPMAYFPVAQQPTIGAEQIELRTTGRPLALLPEVRRAVAALNPALPLQKPLTQAQQFALTYAEPSMFAAMGGFFGLLAALLVATGLYGTLAWRTSRRITEIGVRMALGARSGEVVWLVLRESLTLATWGLVLGLPLLLLGAGLLRSMLWRLSPYDPASLALAVVGVVLVVAVASVAPARRAASVDPIRALRSE